MDEIPEDVMKAACEAYERAREVARAGPRFSEAETIWHPIARAILAERERMKADLDRAVRLLKQRDRLAESSRKYWVRAAESALAGDMRELRNRVELAKAPPLDIVLSEAPPSGQE